MIDLQWEHLYGTRRFHATKQWRPGHWSHPAHRHVGFMEIAYVAKGRIDQMACGKQLRPSTGYLCFLGDQSTHELSGEDSLHYNFNFPVSECERLREFLDLPAEFDPLFPAHNTYHIFPVPYAKQEWLGALWDRLIADESEFANGLTFKRALLELLQEIIIPVREFKRIPRPAYLERLMACVEAEFRPERTVHDLMAMGHVSAAKLNRDFRRYLQVTPSTYLNHQRVRKAAELLRATHSEIAAIAFDTGFESLSYFYRRFRELMGTTPHHYRQMSATDLPGGVMADIGIA